MDIRRLVWEPGRNPVTMPLPKCAASSRQIFDALPATGSGGRSVRPHLAGDEDRRLASRLVMVSAEELAPDDAIKIVEIEKAA